MKKLKHIKLFESYIHEYEEFDDNGGIICYHRSSSFEHMENGDLTIENADERALFGHALYFSSSSDTSQQLGKYIGKYSIKLQEPCLDLNKEISAIEQQELVDRFNKISNSNFETDIDDKLYPNVQFGDILVEIADEYNWDCNKYFKELIESYGYKSFKYFGDYHTDFRHKIGDYGYCYGVYNNDDVQFIAIAN